MVQQPGHPVREELSFIGKALGVMGVGVFVAAFVIELTDVIDRRRYRRSKEAARKAARRVAAAAQVTVEPRPCSCSEKMDGGE